MLTFSCYHYIFFSYSFTKEIHSFYPMFENDSEHFFHKNFCTWDLCPNYLSLEFYFRSDQIRSVTQLCPTLCHSLNHSTPGLPVHHQLPEFTQTHVHRVSDAIQPSHPLSSPSPPAPTPSQHQSFPMSQLFA